MQIEIATTSTMILAPKKEEVEIIHEINEAWIYERRVHGIQVLSYQLQCLVSNVWIYYSEPDLIILSKKAGKAIPIY